MLKKPLFQIGLLGVILIIAGLILNTSFVAKFSSSGLKSFRGITVIYFFQFYSLTIGITLIIAALIINFLPETKRKSYYILAIFITGVIITITGILLNPSYIEQKLLIGKLSPDKISSLRVTQLGFITLGCLIAFVSVFVYRKKFLVNTKKVATAILIIIVFAYITLADILYVNKKYPNNILLKPEGYSKSLDLLLGREILLSDYSPKLSLKLPRKQILKAKFPVIDIHFHFNSDFITEEDKRVLAPEALMKSMDSIGVIMIVGNDGPNIEELIKRYHNKFPDKFLNFTNILSGIPQKNTDEFLAKRPAEMERLVKMGLSGIGELPKELGLKMRDDSGKLISADDPRLDPLYAKAGELGIPIVWHVSDPQPCFEPVDKYNERFIQLGKYPEWSYYGPDFPDKKTLLKQRENVLKKHPSTIFIGAHVGDNADDLNYAAYLFDTYPNYYFEFSSALGDLGRQPYSARKFFIKYQDRILFGTDGGSLFNVAGWSVAKFYRAYFEFLETENEYIDYPLQGAIFQGNWKIFGINLPDEVLEKIYYKNAQKILSKQGINIKVYDK